MKHVSEAVTVAVAEGAKPMATLAPNSAVHFCGIVVVVVVVVVVVSLSWASLQFATDVATLQLRDLSGTLQPGNPVLFIRSEGCQHKNRDKETDIKTALLGVRQFTCIQ